MRDVHLFPKYALCIVFSVCLHVAAWGAPFMDATAAPYRRNTTARLTVRKNQQPVQPTLWHQSDTAIISPSFTDTIAPPTSYTMMMVYQTLQPATPQQLWRISRTDSAFYAITTHGLSTERIQPSTHNNPPRTNPTIYTLQHTLRQDTAYHGIYRLHTGATVSDSSQIALYEVAYFDSRLTKRQSLMFQTYLAIKHGITLDNAPYLSTRGDTLWHPKTDKTYYHRLQGIGTDTVYHLNAKQSTSLEDSLLRIFTPNILPANTYALVGDDDVSLGWSPYENGYALLQRTWLLQTSDTLPNICIALNKDYLPDAPDTLALILLNTDGDITRTIYPDSTNAKYQLCYTVPNPATHTLFSFLTTDNETPNRHQIQKNNQGNNNNNGKNDTEDYTTYGDCAISLSPNPTHGEYVFRISLPQGTDLVLTIQDPTGKVMTRQTITGATDHQYSGYLSVAGMYLFSLYTPDGELLTTRELLVY
ncbi:MAG TPA: hypothetical protein DIW30_00120 [Bacteroidales bacterium]|nr:hypothetical protein [Bacteroidales bacterium]